MLCSLQYSRNTRVSVPLRPQMAMSFLPPPQARNILNIFLRNNNNKIRQSRKLQALRACQTSVRKMHNLSESCTSKCIPDILGCNVVKMTRTDEEIMDCSQDSSPGSEFDDVGISDSLEELSLLNSKLAYIVC